MKFKLIDSTYSVEIFKNSRRVELLVFRSDGVVVASGEGETLAQCAKCSRPYGKLPKDAWRYADPMLCTEAPISAKMPVEQQELREERIAIMTTDGESSLEDAVRYCNEHPDLYGKGKSLKSL